MTTASRIGHSFGRISKSAPGSLSRRKLAGTALFAALLVAIVTPAAESLAKPVSQPAPVGTGQRPPEKPGAQAARKTAGREAAQAGGETGRSDGQERALFSEREIATARPAGLPGRLRVPGDDADAFRALLDGAGAAGDPWLVLSGGGDNGAYAAGLLNGWSQAGDRPAFGVITGVSTGALIAPFAFVGPAADGALKRNYTEITAADVFELGGTTAALTDNWPLKARIDGLVTPDLLRAVAAEHAKGRRLLIATTQVDTERASVWDMGAIASLAAERGGGRDPQRDGKALRLFREIVLASTAIPAVFPPVLIEGIAEDGRRIREMHDDGGAMTPFLLAPEPVLAGRSGSAFRLPARTVYLVVNQRLAPEFGVAPRTVLGVLGRTMSGAIKAQTRGALALARSFAARTGLDLHVAEIDGRFTKESSTPFDQDYMKALFEHGERLGRDGSAFATSQAEAPAAQPAEERRTVKGATAGSESGTTP